MTLFAGVFGLPKIPKIKRGKSPVWRSNGSPISYGCDGSPIPQEQKTTEFRRDGVPTEALCLSLPYPPSVNHYWERNKNGGLRVGSAGLVFRVEVLATVLRTCHKIRRPIFSGAVAVDISVTPPDRRRRDLDNILKSLLDSLTHAGVWEDDAQVAEIHLARQSPGNKKATPKGGCSVNVWSVVELGDGVGDVGTQREAEKNPC